MKGLLLLRVCRLLPVADAWYVAIAACSTRSQATALVLGWAGLERSGHRTRSLNSGRGVSLSGPREDSDLMCGAGGGTYETCTELRGRTVGVNGGLDTSRSQP